MKNANDWSTSNPSAPMSAFQQPPPYSVVQPSTGIYNMNNMIEIPMQTYPNSTGSMGFPPGNSPLDVLSQTLGGNERLTFFPMQKLSK